MSDAAGTPSKVSSTIATDTTMRSGAIPIYRRGYGSARSRGAAAPRPLIWEDGQLRQINVASTTEHRASVVHAHSSIPFPGAVVSRGTGSSAPCPVSSAGLLTPFSLRGRGRGGRPRVRNKLLTRPSTQREDATPTFRIPEMNAELPSPMKRPILPTDTSLPPFRLSTDEPLPSNSVLFPALEGDQATGSTSGPLSKKMKSSTSSSVDDLDIETLKTYRRLNGYTLFTLAMKKKYDVSGDDGGQDQKSQNRRWQALWSTLPERDRQQWRVRARRTQKAVEAAPEKSLAAEAKRANELRRAEAQLVRTETSKYSLLDLAAHFQLLSDVFGSAADLMGDYRGPVAVDEVCSSLLDALLSCLIPLTAIASEVESLAGAPEKSTVCTGLSSLAHIFPNF